MRIQADYNSNINWPSAVGQEQVKPNRGTETPEYRAIQNKAARLLANPEVSPLERTQILSLLARGQIAAENGAVGELKTLYGEIKKFDPGLEAQKVSFDPKPAEPQGASAAKDETSVTYKDQSGDAGVSFKYPVAMNQYQGPLAVSAHERQHVASAQAEALMNHEDVTSYVSIHTGYDRNGRLIVTGGRTTTITHPKKEIEPAQPGDKVQITV
ncbi:MAG: hypothetical protein EHM45_18175 [Desulfobacteraceae bacterium]|nr:MAG: hypothetical protein EHM45_18175 [Desulfobacteraceae bacterium]